MGQTLELRRESSSERLRLLGESLGDAEGEVGDKACVYAIGSFGRGEAGQHSDLDLFIASRMGRSERGSGRVPLLKRLDEICLKSDIIRASRKQSFPDFSKDGRFLMHFSLDSLINNIGHFNDDVENTLTARLLLLLESRCLIGYGVYDAIISKVIDAYWLEFDRHKNDFMPAFIVNDILRLWRTFCINYEMRSEKDEDTDYVEKKRIKNYKLRQSRMLTCHSAILCLLHGYGTSGTVSPTDFRRIVDLTPTQRLESVSEDANVDLSIAQQCKDIIEMYEEFLELTNHSEDEMIRIFADPEQARMRDAKAKLFGEAMFAVMSAVGTRGKAPALYRMLIV